MKSNKGFTLVEILVVVLIIGILVAIALPQYQKAVRKSEVAKVISLVRIIAEQQKIYHLANNKFAESLNDLDISVKEPDGWICHLYSAASPTNENNAIECIADSTISVVYYYGVRSEHHEMEQQLYCWAKHGATKDIQACSTFGPQINDYSSGVRFAIQ